MVRVISILTLFSALLLIGPGAASAKNVNRYLAPEGHCAKTDSDLYSVAEQERGMRCLINYARKKAGKSRLRADAKLKRSARSKLNDLFKCQVFEHAPCKGKGVFSGLKQSGYTKGCKSWEAGENLAWGTGAKSSPREIMRAWLHSTPHRRNIMRGGWQEQAVSLRIGKFVGQDSAAVWVSHFGRCK